MRHWRRLPPRNVSLFSAFFPPFAYTRVKGRTPAARSGLPDLLSRRLGSTTFNSPPAISEDVYVRKSPAATPPSSKTSGEALLLIFNTSRVVFSLSLIWPGVAD